MSRASSAPRRVGLMPTSTVLVSAVAPSQIGSSGTFSSSTPTWGGLPSGRLVERGRPRAARRPRTYSSHVHESSSKRSATRSSPARLRIMSATLPTVRSAARCVIRLQSEGEAGPGPVERHQPPGSRQRDVRGACGRARRTRRWWSSGRAVSTYSWPEPSGSTMHRPCVIAATTTLPLSSTASESKWLLVASITSGCGCGDRARRRRGPTPSRRPVMLSATYRRDSVGREADAVGPVHGERDRARSCEPSASA